MSKFVLIGGGDISAGETEKIDRFIINLVGKKNSTILFFPTAANDSRGYADLFKKYYLSLGCREINSCFVQTENTESILEKMRKADVIYLGGGQTSLLVDHFIEKNLVGVLKDLAGGGTVIVGMSAGAIALGNTALLSELEEQEEVFGRGWGLIPKTICIPHYRQRYQRKINRFQSRFPSQNILTIREKQAYFVETAGKEIFKQTLIDG